MEPDSTGQSVATEAAAPAAPAAPAPQPAAAEVVAAPASPPSSSRSDFSEGFRAAQSEPQPEAVAPRAEDAPAPKADVPKAAAKPADPAPEPAAAPSEPVKSRDEIIAEYEAQRADAAARDADAKAARDAVTEAEEALTGKPGELAALLQKEATQGWLENDDNERKLALVRGASTYHTALAKAQRDVQADTNRRIADAQTESQQIVDGVLTQIGKAYQSLIGRPGIDAAVITGTADPALVNAHIYDAGASSRQAEIDALKGEKEHLSAQLAESRGQVFRSQPPVETGGGISQNGRGAPVLAPGASPRDEFRQGFSTATNGQNGRR